MMEIKQETVNAIVNYLVSKPYQEVVGLIQMISNDIELSKNVNDKEEE